MGVDITMVAERKSSQSGEWELAEPPVVPAYYERSRNLRLKPQTITINRNSAFFAILADVNNGCFSEEDFNTVTPFPRGFPS
ncbi:MAG: hypothetical protein ACK5LK_05100, partial [Chthoniobacterales bacterium]